ncbi:AAA family ATPase [Mycolicibacterium arseniciresistens]|uniref:MoxR family ATPase n=1 Tax=Mycolicibacterium arseniciresistens TaxID=3062257 RepID=A0ABT8UAD0_9MYCO|nr:MoxR family ATPase [Mycolicibacterium arseniciresistens]MDO3634748.1 MoxR family ATPase [Mycolicibacterium arseniciresistens]
MTTSSPSDVEQLDRTRRVVAGIAEAFSAKVVGQENLRETLLIGLLTSGHILLEGVPGLAKTTAARVVAESISGGFQRIQCTPDLLPSDIIGTQIYDSATSSFVTQLGPVHTNIVVLDEINRSSAKTQSAMLEAMEERQTTIAGQLYPIPEPFLVIATQNPVDQEGTYPLSEAQTDRFMLKEVLRYPTPQEEAEVMFRMDAGVYDRAHTTPPVITLDEMRMIQQVAARVHLDPKLVHYVSQLVYATRNPDEFLTPQLARLVEYGASPRATIAFCRSARALALLAGRNHVLPDDIRDLAHRVLRHRLVLGFEAVSAGVTSETVVDAVMQSVRVP